MKSQLFLLTAACAAFAVSSCSKPAGTASSGSGSAPAAADAIALKVELPQELTIGTPKDLTATPNLDTNRKPDPIKVPKDAVLLSKGKTVTSGDKEEPFEGELKMITDGEKNGNEGYSVILSEGPQWVQIDLGASATVDGVVLWHYFKNDRVTFDVIVQVSDDPEFKTGVTTLFNSDVDNSCGQGAGTDKAYIGTYLGKQIAGNGAKGKFVRCWSNGNTDNKMNEYIEVEVWGRAAK
jgi:hypothetical protein